jgi:hypothetical protein
MSLHEIVSHEIADPIVKFGGALQIGEQEGQTGDFQSLIDVERLGAINIAECLVGQKPLWRSGTDAAWQAGHAVGR